MTIAHVPQLDATVAVWREQDGRTARVDDRDGWRQTIVPHRTALVAICAIAATTPSPARCATRPPAPSPTTQPTSSDAAPLSSDAGGSLRGHG
jgi:hypothetical protein